MRRSVHFYKIFLIGEILHSLEISYKKQFYSIETANLITKNFVKTQAWNF